MCCSCLAWSEPAEMRVHPHTIAFTLRRLLRDAISIVGAVAVGAVPHPAFARQRGTADGGGAAAGNTLALARAVNRLRYGDLPARAIEHAKMILASTFSSAAPGALID